MAIALSFCISYCISCWQLVFRDVKMVKPLTFPLTPPCVWRGFEWNVLTSIFILYIFGIWYILQWFWWSPDFQSSTIIRTKFKSQIYILSANYDVNMVNSEPNKTLACQHCEQVQPDRGARMTVHSLAISEITQVPAHFITLYKNLNTYSAVNLVSGHWESPICVISKGLQ